LFWDATLKNYYILNGNQKIYLKTSATPVIPLVYALGFLHEFVLVDPSVDGYEAKLPAAFKDIYNASKTGVYNVGTYKLELIAFALRFDATNQIQMYYFIENSTGTYRAAFTYNMNVTSDLKVTFSLVSQDANASVIASGLTPMLNYFKNNTFKIEYYVDPDFGLMAGFYPEQTPAAYFYGFLE
jgi:hypothetical protein